MTSPASSHRPSDTSGSARLMASTAPEVRASPYRRAAVIPARATVAASSCWPMPSSMSDSVMSARSSGW